MQHGGTKYEWTNTNGESLCREKDKGMIKRLKDLVVAGHHKCVSMLMAKCVSA